MDGNEMLYNETLDVISLNAIPLNVYKRWAILAQYI